MSEKPKHPLPMLIAFSGIDGAGKSTQIAYLCASLEQAGRRVRLLSFWDDVAKMKSLREGVGHKVFKGDEGVGTPERPIKRRDKNVQSPVMTFVRLAIYLIDAVSLRKTVHKALRTQVNVVIFDRYIYDELANLNLGNAAVRLYIKGIMALVPKPNVSFFLDADPEQAFCRKPEYPIEFLHSNRRAYHALSQLLGCNTVISPMSISDVRNQIAAHIYRAPFFQPSTCANFETAKPNTECRSEVAR
jgi:thymidylate kinase